MTGSITFSAEGGLVGKKNKRATRSSWLRNFLAIDERVFFISLAQTPIGKLMMTAIAILGTAPYLGYWYSICAIFGAMFAVSCPKSRDLILFALTWLTAFFATALGNIDTLEHITILMNQEHIKTIPPVTLAIGFLAVFSILSSVLLSQVRRFPRSLISRHPLISLLIFEAILCGLGSLNLISGLPRVILWSVIFVLTPYIWFLPYAIQDQRTRNPSSHLFQMASLRPFWSPAYLPFGKGAIFLQKHLSKTDYDLAVTQLKGTKLIIWSNLLMFISNTLSWLLIGHKLLPSMTESIDAFLIGNPYSQSISWAAVILSTIKFSLLTAFWSGLFIGIARLAGYRLPRGCWRPLESRNLIEYFNRFHYYFKELLVDLFFIPTFFKVFREFPRLRMFFSTFMAAGIGNGLWHFLRDIELVATQGPVNAINSFSSYLFYCIILATSVGISQVRVMMGIRPSSSILGRIYSFVFVWIFVACMHIFSDGSRNHSLGERLLFLGSLFGVS